MGRLLLCAGLVLGLGACAHSPSYDPADPLEKVNRPIFTFNMKADKYVLRPVAKAYVEVVPDTARLGISNFLDNLFYPTTIVNDLLQAKFVQGGQDTLRFVLNTTIGLAGFLDVATGQGLKRNDEDLGQTFGRWGVGEGWYLMLPLLGPTSNRDLVGRVGDNWTEILQYNDSVTWTERIALAGVNVIDSRARLLGADKALDDQLDQYVFIRTAYLDRRQNLVYDGNPPEEDLGFDENADDSSTPPVDAKPADDGKKKKKKKKKQPAEVAPADAPAP